MQHLKDLVEKAKSAIEQIENKSLTTLDEIRVEYFGKKGHFTQLMQELRNVAAEERPAMGAKINEAYRKRIPYGMQNFEDVMERDCYYVDKTPFIEKIEESNMYFFFIRPRRFGKSLTLSMLENYYDINKKDKFESLFGKLYIGENPTPERNSYLILHLKFCHDFSRIG